METSTGNAQQKASPKSSTGSPIPSRCRSISSSKEGTDQSTITVERRLSTGSSSSPIISTESSNKIEADGDEEEQGPFLAAQTQQLHPLESASLFEGAPLPFEMESNAMDQVSKEAPSQVQHNDASFDAIIKQADSIFGIPTTSNASTTAPRDLSSKEFNRRVRFLALVGDYAGRVFNSIRLAAQDMGFDGFPQRAGNLLEALKNERKDSAHGELHNHIDEASGDNNGAGGSSKTELIRRCIDHLTSQDSAMAAVNLDVDAVHLAAIIYENRNAAFHCPIGHPRTRKDNRATEEICDKHQGEFQRYLEPAQSRNPVLIEQIKRIMSFYPASVDWMQKRNASKLKPTLTPTTTTTTTTTTVTTAAATMTTTKTTTTTTTSGGEVSTHGES